MALFLSDAADPNNETQINIMKEGRGKTPKQGDYITLHYKMRVQGQHHDFDDTWLIKKPYTFKLDPGARKVIDGWEKAFLSGKLKEGTTAELVIPYQEAYYEKGAPPYVPARSGIVCKIEVLSVNDHRCVIL
ncbi:predicted protein [Naegleria gruberi]|uniref:peptidylprolyl isomerase n=1 Tax=Naegleria gruberi TaxID=5762 RepID=D2VAT2_NAEGR|nr:uncharacterized protein NAEGRDRAFT_65966 [Naegleria gruberi]EFC46134.1 predicted protein [Naegleria gruberi]|eukprot:XP_002678878.1 predicted protein [Naegleria gruberi strain NEG-M]